MTFNLGSLCMAILWNSIFIGIVPLLLTFGCFKLLKKKVNIIVLIFGIVALGIILSVLGIC